MRYSKKLEMKVKDAFMKNIHKDNFREEIKKKVFKHCNNPNHIDRIIDVHKSHWINEWVNIMKEFQKKPVDVLDPTIADWDHLTNEQKEKYI